MNSLKMNRYDKNIFEKDPGHIGFRNEIVFWHTFGFDKKHLISLESSHRIKRKRQRSDVIVNDLYSYMH